MKHVAPNQPPTELIRWIAQCRSASIEIDYDTVGQVEIDGEKRDVKAAIKRQRLVDQGYICPYTLVRIDEASCHIEHIKPRAVSKAEGRREETLDYGNLVACFPAKGSDKTYGCGAPLREDKLLALSPRDPRCEVVARYQSTGRVEAAAGWELVAHTLDTLLGLNCIWLSERRKAALSGAGVSICSSNPLSAAAAKDLRETILRFRPGQKLAPFCVAIAHVAQEHIDRLEKLAAKRRFSRQGRQQDH
jgi:uncharacterized protein (TIGR02646 family)